MPHLEPGTAGSPKFMRSRGKFSRSRCIRVPRPQERREVRLASCARYAACHVPSEHLQNAKEDSLQCWEPYWADSYS
ncbi:hypothetical protein NDU88_004493 [Pleurodeles waltl]|uniref:Uncharacterized protein n=1 Tax=Pleurodeles waltl TaxID=8319 RepID=A0AAV7WVU5_PLEWA|nr:hypothetical protein NDU88_004493 [Pleurodeles waltl]